MKRPFRWAMSFSFPKTEREKEEICLPISAFVVQSAVIDDIDGR
jgi:hypothetical protein